MKIHIHSQDFPMSRAIETQIRGRLISSLDAHLSRIREIEVFVRDINGPRGGPDKSVRINIGLRRGPVVTVQETKSNLYAAISVAAGRARRAVNRQLDRRRAGRRTGRPRS